MSLIEKLDGVLARLGETSEGHYLSRLANGTSIALEAVNLLRDHGPAIRQALLDSERYAWLKEGENDSEVLEFNTHGNAGPDDVWLPRGKGLDDAIDAARANRLAHYAAIDSRLASDSATGEGEGHD